jgi:lipid II:glycine glycyltransferase (peptidoglycan interpeptide bridge formation enzyme)
MKSKKKLEERYIQLLNKANKVSEMLEIEEKLAEIREEIEAKEGQLKYLENRISMSTIAIEMYTLDPSESGTTDSYGSKIWNSIKEGFNGLSNFLLSIISIWPFILIFVGIYIWIRKRFLNKRNKS